MVTCNVVGLEWPLEHVHPLHRIIHLQEILDKFVPPSDALQIIRLSSFESPLIGTIVKAWDPPCLRIPLESMSDANRKSWRTDLFIKKVDSWYSGRCLICKPNAHNNSIKGSLINNRPSICRSWGETCNLITSRDITLLIQIKTHTIKIGTLVKFPRAPKSRNSYWVMSAWIIDQSE